MRGSIPGVLMLTAVCLLAMCGTAAAQQLDEFPLERWSKLREVERYQLQIAEKFWREKNYKAALTEYEKFLSLYETSEGAAYSMLKWSQCQLELKKANTAISEGFQSIVDYWPESPEAVAASFYIGRTYKDMGEIRKAKKAYQDVLKNHPKHLVAVYSLVDLADVAAIDEDVDAQVAAWKKLTFEIERSREANPHCENASRQLAVYSFQSAKFQDGLKALATTYADPQLPDHVRAYIVSPISQLTGSEETKAKGEKLADEAVAWARSFAPAGNAEGEVTLARSCYYAAADIHAASRRADKVIETYAAIQSRFGAEDETLRRLGEWWKSQNEYDKARIEFAKFQNQVEGQNQIAYSFRQQQNYDQAVVAYQRNLSLDPDNQAKWNDLIAYTYREARKYPEAVKVYQDILASDPDNTDRWMWNIAITYRDGGMHKEAIGAFRQCANFPANVEQMAYCQRALKQYKEAVLLYSQIVSAAPAAAPAALLQIGYTYEDAGNTEQAIKSFQQVCKQFPKDGHASRAHAHLQTKYNISVTLGGAKDE